MKRFYHKIYNIYFFVLTHFLIVLAKSLSFFVYKNKVNKNSVLFLENFPIENAGYQYRAAKWIPYFEEAGYKAEVWTIVEDKKKFDKYLSHKHSLFLIKSMCKRFFQIIKSRRFEIVIVRRELLLFNDYGNLFMEKFLLKIHPNAILDFDDDIAASKRQPKEITNLYAKLLMENGNKFNESLNLYKRFVVGSEYLKELVLKRSPNTNVENIVVIPTCVDYNKFPPKQYPTNLKKITFGWIGGDHNYHLLENLIPVFNKLADFYKFKLIVIAGTAPKWHTNFEFEFIPWSLKTEVENLYKIDVGLMPVSDNAVGKGKCGFKLIQYMSLGIPAIASDVGANEQIVEHKINGWLTDNNNWERNILLILKNSHSLHIYGRKARITAINNYSFSSNIENYTKFLSMLKR